MADLQGKPGGTAHVRASLTTGLSAEGWQWLAFLFAAVVTLASDLLDDLVAHHWWRAGFRLAVALGLFYLFLLCRPFRQWARQQLEKIRWDTR